MDGSTWISLFSLFVSGGIAAYTYRFSRTQQRLNEMLIREKQAEQEDARRAVLHVEIEGAAPAVDVFFTSEDPDNEFAKGMGAVSPLTHFHHVLIERGKTGLCLRSPPVRLHTSVDEPRSVQWIFFRFCKVLQGCCHQS